MNADTVLYRDASSSSTNVPPGTAEFRVGPFFRPRSTGRGVAYGRRPGYKRRPDRKASVWLDGKRMTGSRFILSFTAFFVFSVWLDRNAQNIGSTSNPALAQPEAHLQAEAMPEGEDRPRLFMYLIDGLRWQSATDPELLPALIALEPDGVAGRVEPCFDKLTAQCIQSALTGTTSRSIYSFIGNLMPSESGAGADVLYSLSRRGYVIETVSDFVFPKAYGDALTASLMPGTDFERSIENEVEQALALFADKEVDVVILHSTAWDALGHAKGATSPEYRAMGRRYNALIDQVARTVGPDDHLLIFGDHGMTDDGRHLQGLDIPTYYLYRGNAVRAGVRQPINMEDHHFFLSVIFELPFNPGYQGKFYWDAVTDDRKSAYGDITRYAHEEDGAAAGEDASAWLSSVSFYLSFSLAFLGMWMLIARPHRDPLAPKESADDGPHPGWLGALRARLARWDKRSAVVVSALASVLVIVGLHATALVSLNAYLVVRFVLRPPTVPAGKTSRSGHIAWLCLVAVLAVFLHGLSYAPVRFLIHDQPVTTQANLILLSALAVAFFVRGYLRAAPALRETSWLATSIAVFRPLPLTVTCVLGLGYLFVAFPTIYDYGTARFITWGIIIIMIGFWLEVVVAKDKPRMGSVWGLVLLSGLAAAYLKIHTGVYVENFILVHFQFYHDYRDISFVRIGMPSLSYIAAAAVFAMPMGPGRTSARAALTTAFVLALAWTVTMGWLPVPPALSIAAIFGWGVFRRWPGKFAIPGLSRPVLGFVLIEVFIAFGFEHNWTYLSLVNGAVFVAFVLTRLMSKTHADRPWLAGVGLVLLFYYLFFGMFGLRPTGLDFQFTFTFVPLENKEQYWFVIALALVAKYGAPVFLILDASRLGGVPLAHRHAHRLLAVKVMLMIPFLLGAVFFDSKTYLVTFDSLAEALFLLIGSLIMMVYAWFPRPDGQSDGSSSAPDAAPAPEP